MKASEFICIIKIAEAICIKYRGQGNTSPVNDQVIGVTAMIGVLLFGQMGILDLSLIYINPTFLWSAPPPETPNMAE